MTRQRQADPDTTPLPAPVLARLAQLFRHATRAGRVHPLQHLLQRFRNGDRG